jgi:hypothetical protein
MLRFQEMKHVMDFTHLRDEGQKFPIPDPEILLPFDLFVVMKWNNIAAQLYFDCLSLFMGCHSLNIFTR